MREKQAQEEMEARNREREAQLVLSEVAAHEADEAAKAEAARQRNIKAKMDRAAQVRCPSARQGGS